jgi:dihydrofolate synthase / folylpolyglutamate synthase
MNFSERIRIDGKKISESDIIKYTKLYKKEIIKQKATFFEATTAIAYKYFSDQSVDAAVIETGLGGRLDATNVITPVLSVITDIGIDHTAHLGKTIKKIAYEKGGIIKPGICCITTAGNENALHELRRIAHLKKSELIECDKLSFESVKEMGLEGTRLDFKIPGLILRNLVLPLSGAHQIRNLRGALTALQWLSTEGKFKNISESNIRNGLSKIRFNTGLRGRLDIVNQAPLMIADVAHNPEGIRVITEGLKMMFPSRFVVVFGVMADKDYREMMHIIAPITRFLIASALRTPRALGSNEIVRIANQEGIRAVKGVDTAKCIAIARNEVRCNEGILLAGSHYLIGEAFEGIGIIP